MAIDPRFSARLQQAVKAGMVTFDPLANTATILAPPNTGALSDDDWLNILQAAGEVRLELERLGYTVSG